MSTPPPTDYELYLRVPELLRLQKPPSERACPDELLFQVVHQAAELWMKLVDHEMQLLASVRCWVAARGKSRRALSACWPFPPRSIRTSSRC